ncbi:MAG: hypothetical protein K8J31_16545 [Anaerolineae bacterium]|nr:hypothetical protein [Anaerolineae bacterium]
MNRINEAKMSTVIPDVLSNYAAFQQWIEGQMSGLQGHDKGNPWQEFAKHLVPLTDFGKNFQNFKDNPRKTHDKGWDIKADGTSDHDTRTLFTQTKFKMPSQNDLDAVISSFVPLAGVKEGQMPLSGMAVDREDVFSPS